jgi:hypothetical protein
MKLGSEYMEQANNVPLGGLITEDVERRSGLVSVVFWKAGQMMEIKDIRHRNNGKDV